MHGGRVRPVFRIVHDRVCELEGKREGPEDCFDREDIVNSGVKSMFGWRSAEGINGL
jgi:hypothetical protein